MTVKVELPDTMYRIACERARIRGLQRGRDPGVAPLLREGLRMVLNKAGHSNAEIDGEPVDNHVLR